MVMAHLRAEGDGRPTLHVETGAFLRDFIKGDSYTAELTRRVVESGGLIPEAIAVAVWTEYLFNHYTGSEHIVFDGCPRKLHEVLLLDSVVRFYKLEKPIVVYLNVGEDWARERLLHRGRKDDTEEGITKRMKWFADEVMPSVNFYKTNPGYTYIEVDGERSVEEVHQDILAKAGLK